MLNANVLTVMYSGLCVMNPERDSRTTSRHLFKFSCQRRVFGGIGAVRVGRVSSPGPWFAEREFLNDVIREIKEIKEISIRSS